MGVEPPPPTLRICHFAGKNGSAMYFCKATYWTKDHSSATVTDKKVTDKKFCSRATSDTPRNSLKLRPGIKHLVKRKESDPCGITNFLYNKVFGPRTEASFTFS